MSNVLRIVCLVAMAILLVLSIPWYREEAATVSTIGGFPEWVVVALGCYGLIAAINAAIWLLLAKSTGKGE